MTPVYVNVRRPGRVLAWLIWLVVLFVLTSNSLLLGAWIILTVVVVVVRLWIGSRPVVPEETPPPPGLDAEVLVRLLERLVEAGSTPEDRDPPREPPRRIQARRD